MSDDPSQHPEEEPAPDRLVFQWAHREKRGLWLFAGAVLAVSCLAFVTVVVRVARVEPRTVELASHEILFLDPSSALAQPVIARAADRSFLLMGKRAPDEAEPSLTNASPVFIPSFKGFELQPKDLPETRTESTVPRWLKPDDAPLPVHPEVADAKAHEFPQVVPEYRLRVVAGDGLETRTITRRVKVAGPILDDAVNIAFRTAVDAAGRVVLALPVQDESSAIKDVENLRKAINRLRFEPKPDSDLTWGTIAFAWEAQTGK